MKILAIFITTILVQGINSPASAQRQPIDGDWNSPKCIEFVWEKTNPTIEEKKFDLENDPDLYGYRFSCYSQISPTEIDSALTEIKSAIQNEDKDKLADLVVYPLSYWVSTAEYDPMFGYFSPAEVTSKREFIERYDDIVTPDVKKIMTCTNVSKLSTNGEGSLFVAHGYIHIRKQPDFNKEPITDYNKYPLRIALIGSFIERTENWYQTHCQ